MRRRTISAGAALALLALAACGGETGPPVLNWYTINDDGGQATIAEACTEEADGEYVIDVSMLPLESTAQREEFARRLAAEDDSIDIMGLDPPFVPEFAEAGFLAEVPDELQDTDGIVQGAVDSATWGDDLVAVPLFANVQLNRRGFDAAFFFVERMSSCRRKSIPLLVSGQCVWCWSITRSIRL